MMVVGVDPGLSGAVAFVDSDDGIRGCVDMPVLDGVVSPALLYRELIGRGFPRLVVVEHVHAMPKQGVTSSFGFGRSLGVVEGCVAALRCPVEMVRPAAWKKAMGVSADKGTSRRRALELWPEHADLFARAKDDGRAEACLLACWGLRLLAQRRGQ